MKQLADYYVVPTKTAKEMLSKWERPNPDPIDPIKAALEQVARAMAALKEVEKILKGGE